MPARRPGASGVSGARLLLAVLALCCCNGLGAAAAGKRTFGFRIQSRDFQPTFRRSLLRNATMPLHGAVKDYGYFYATLYLGTPAKKFAVIVDTGSTMTYVPCSTCGSGCGPNHQDAFFDPEASSTAQLISCSSPKCVCGSPRCGCSAQQCTYMRSYAEQSSSSGILLEDKLALHDGLEGAPIIFGCETRETGEIFKQRADGLFGLGNSDASVVNQLVKAGVIDDVFSLCFGMVEGDGALLLGDAEVPGSIVLQYTPLLTSASHPFYYNVKLLSMAVDGQLLPVSQSLFDQGYGTVLDSGTTFTYMPSPAFHAFASAVESYALSHGLKRVPGPDPQYDDICFGQAPDHRDLEALSAVFPSMEIQFDQGTALVLGPLNYLFVHTFNSGKYCLGVFDNGRAGTLLGGITFRNVLVRYDRANRQVGFGPAPCKELGEMQRPPCAFFATEGSGDVAAAAAADDGDCSMEPTRQQQQETFDDILDDEDDVMADGQDGNGGEPLPQQAVDDSGSAVQSATQWRRPPEEKQKQGEQQQQQTAHQPEQQVEAQGEQPLDQPLYRPAHGEQKPEPVVVNGSNESKQQHSRLAGVVLGMLVAVVAVLSLGLAVALLQPATRDRIRAAFGSSRQYRTLQEDEQDPEDGVFGAAVPGATIPVVAAAASASVHGGSAVELQIVDLNSNSSSSQHMKSIELGSRGSPEHPTRGHLTSPQKLQRSTSNTAEAAAEAAAGLKIQTPRAGSPLRP